MTGTDKCTFCGHRDGTRLARLRVSPALPSALESIKGPFKFIDGYQSYLLCEDCHQSNDDLRTVTEVIEKEIT